MYGTSLCAEAVRGQQQGQHQPRHPDQLEEAAPRVSRKLTARWFGPVESRRRSSESVPRRRPEEQFQEHQRDPDFDYAERGDVRASDECGRPFGNSGRVREIGESGPASPTRQSPESAVEQTSQEAADEPGAKNGQPDVPQRLSSLILTAVVMMPSKMRRRPSGARRKQ